jgi:hypothetical protein
VLERVEAVTRMPACATDDDRELRHRAFRALVELLARMRDRTPLVLHVDDLHWSDVDSMVLFEHLLSDVGAPPILMLLSHRELVAPAAELFAPLAHAARVNARLAVRELVLGPLSRDDATTLARRLVSGDDTPRRDALIETIAGEAAGSPYFIAELSQHVAQTGAATPARDASLRDALGERIDALAPTARRLLELLALSGRPVPDDVLGLAVGGMRPHPRDALDLLRAAQLVRADHARAFECFHDRIRVAVIDRLAETARRDHHADLVRAWTECGRAEPDLLLAHCLGAGLREEAGRHAIAAARKAIHALAFERGAELYRQALDLASEDEIERFRLRDRRAEALSIAGRWAEAADAFVSAAEHASDGRRRSYLLHWAAHHYLGSGRGAEGLPRLRSNLARMRIGWPRTRWGALLGSVARLLRLWLTGARYELADPQGTAAHFDGLGRTHERFYPIDDARPGEAVVLEMLMAGAVLVPPYDLARGVHFITAFAARALRTGDPERVPIALGMLSSLFAARPATAAFARRLADSAVAIVRGSVPSHLGAAALAFVAFARLREGRLREAHALAADAEAMVRDAGSAHAYTVWTARSVQCLALAALGHVREAAAVSALTGREARARGDELAALGGETVLGYLVADDLEGAEAFVRRKEAALPRIGRFGALYQIVLIERTLLALYAGRGHAHAHSLRGEIAASLAPFDVRALAAQCALQAMEGGDRDPAHRAIVQGTIRGLERDRAPGSPALALQLRAALARFDGDLDGALAQLEAARESYARAEMAMHEAVLVWRLGSLRGSGAGEPLAEEGERFMRAEGVVNPAAWARMLAPGC